MNNKNYTSLIDLYGKTNFLPYTELSEKYVDWINKTCMELIEKSTYSENLFKKKMSENKVDFVEQAFFMINGKSYFLDFIIPKYMIAIEVDGASHICKEENDFERDKLFKSVGIKTLRISNSDVYRKDFISFLFDKIDKLYNDEISVYDYYRTPRVNRYENKKTINQKLLDKTIKYLKTLEYGNSTLIKTDATYLIYSIINVIDENKETPNIEQIKDIHSIIDKHKLVVIINFVGNRKKLNPKLIKRLHEFDYYNLMHEFDSIIDITFETIKNYK